MVKPSIRDFCILYSKTRARKKRYAIKFWYACLKICLQEKNWKEVSRIKELISNFMLEGAAGHKVRSRFKGNATGESASLFHANQEVKNNQRNSLSKLKVCNSVTDDQQAIEQEVLGFFRALFNGHHNTDLIDTGSPFVPDFSNLSSYLDEVSSLPDEISDTLSSKMELDELRYIITQCANNKTPGLDGITYEFYKAVLDTIQEDLLEVLQCQLDRNNIVESNRKGVTRLLPKVQGIPCVDELRPITLLNCDYKLLTKWFVLRMKPVLPYVIKSGQLCTVGDRNILFGVSNIVSSMARVKESRSSGCIISLDFFKAYDRVFLGFLLKVLQKMNFSSVFIAWIGMLHEGASTCFILQSLTAEIVVSFSIRQGDPLAMLLYIVYIEPFLVALERCLSGLQLRGPSLEFSAVEAYCDDVNILTDNDEDFPKINQEIENFEKVSGAILSRCKKSKVMGFGKWNKRENWPLSWLACERSIKVFGIFLSDKYSEMINTNWNYRYEKVQRAIFSWSSRTLLTIQQKVEVIRIFALSRTYYVASILPLKACFVKKFESLIGKFIWKGPFSFLRVPYDELKNQKLEGGLLLPCLATMGRALLTSQCIRLLRNGNRRYVNHIDYWLGSLLGNIIPGMGTATQATVDNSYFFYLGDCLGTVLTCGLLTTNSLRTLTNRQIYLQLADFPLPKVVREALPGQNYKPVWERLYSPYLNAESKELLFLLIHNKLPVPERLFRIGMRNDSFCAFCPGAVTADIEHFFASCVRTKDAWSWLRTRLSHLVKPGILVSNLDLLKLFLPSESVHAQHGMIWMIGKFVSYVWNIVFHKDSTVKLRKFIGYLKFKFKDEMLSNKPSLSHIEHIL